MLDFDEDHLQPMVIGFQRKLLTPFICHDLLGPDEDHLQLMVIGFQPKIAYEPLIAMAFRPWMKIDDMELALAKIIFAVNVIILIKQDE